jgi:hypothetical protein
VWKVFDLPKSRFFLWGYAPTFVLGEDRFGRAVIVGLFRSGLAQNVGGVAPGNKSQLPEGQRPSAHQAAEPRKHWLKKLCRYLRVSSPANVRHASAKTRSTSGEVPSLRNISQSFKMALVKAAGYARGSALPHTWKIRKNSYNGHV